jgi:HAD superfamily hydrolase (TIGR01549 family)
VADRWVCFDVGETLIDETRVWETWADLLEVPRFTFMAAMGAAVSPGDDHRAVFEMVGHPEWRTKQAEFETAYGGFQPTDLYPDALPCLTALRAAGYRLAILANQPRTRTAELRALGVDVDVMAMSDELGVAKPAPEFYARALDLMGVNAADAKTITYVGDRLDFDVLPSAAAGMRPVWLRRGPWGLIVNDPPPAGTIVVGTLSELVERIDEVWT